MMVITYPTRVGISGLKISKMAPIFLHNGGILLRNGMIATSQNCCCSSSSSSSSVVIDEGCDCDIILANICNQIDLSITNIFTVTAGVGFNATFNLVFGNVPFKFQGRNGVFQLTQNGNPIPPAEGGIITANAEILCIINGLKAEITLRITLVGDGNQFCDIDLLIPFQSATLELVIPEIECNIEQFADITGNYALNLVATNPNGCGINTVTQWNISSQPIGAVCP